MTDLVLIHPGAVHGIYGPLGETLVAVEPPLWCRIIASYFLGRGRSVAIVDQEAERMSAQEVAACVDALDPRLVAICVHGHQPSASTQQMAGARAVAVCLDNRHRVIMLGNHPSALPARTLREEPVDYVCDGEGPLTIEGLLQDKHPGLIPGLVWEHEGRVIQNPRAPLLDMDRDLHGSSAWHLLPMERYAAHNWQCLDDPARRRPYASIHTSLGCSFKCSFCCINIFQHNNLYRRRDPHSVVAEMLMLYNQHGVRTFKITDELFVLNRTHFRSICDLLVSSGIADDINVWAYSRTDTVRDEDLPLLRAAGIRWLALGIESGSARVRAGANKALRRDDDNSDIRRTVDAIRAADINVIGNYIVGLPDDDLESMEETYRLAANLNTEFMNVYSAMAYPGSPLYDQAVAEGWTLPASWAGYSQHNEHARPLDTKHVSGAEVLRFRDDFFRRYYARPEYLDMVRARFGDAAIEEIQKMTRYELKRNLLEAVR